ncbi:MAG: hypothetical protein QOF07_2383 [Bradyrhizobium sp.]|jgi:hypothetical protein|nr:hypothetical protein [Bradyrhizobium sp.]
MVDDTPEDAQLSPDSGRPKRSPPTIDLEASEVTGEIRNPDADAEPQPSSEQPSSQRRRRSTVPSALIAAVSGASAAALMMGLAWALGWPGELVAPTPPAAPAVNSAGIDDLAARVAAIESKAGKPATAAPDPALAARADALEKSLAALRGELAGLREQSDKIAATVNDVKSAPRDSSPPPDLTAINQRIAELEGAARAQSAEIAQENAKPADDVPLRRVVAAALLDVSVRNGDPYGAALAAAKPLVANPDALKPLDGFAASGVPSAASLSRELLALVPKLSPTAAENSTAGSSLVERLQAGAAKLVRIERTDTAGSDRGNVVARVTAAALRNDVNEARRELNSLPPGDRAAAQGWIEKADARDAALAASRQFASDAMTALAKPTQ